MHMHTLFHMYELGKKTVEAVQHWRHSREPKAERGAGGPTAAARVDTCDRFEWYAAEPGREMDFISYVFVTSDRKAARAEDMLGMLASHKDLVRLAPAARAKYAQVRRGHPGKVIIMRQRPDWDD